MKVIICEKPGQLQIEERPMPGRGTDEALLKVSRIGICGTDLHAYAGRQPFFSYPRILGHELSAEVVEVDSNAMGLRNGDRVVVMPYVNCGACIACRCGKSNCCDRLQVLGVHTDGGMQEYLSLPVGLLLPAGDLDADQAAIVEPLSIGAHAVRRAAVEAGEWVLVIGAGPIGIGIMRLAQLCGAGVIAMDINAGRLDFCRKTLGVEHTIHANAGEDTLALLHDITAGEGATAVFDATGNQRAMESGVDYMAHGGRFLLVGLFKGRLSFYHPAIHAKEASLLCSRNATLEDFRRVMKILQEKSFPAGKYITHHLPFDQLPSGFEEVTQAGWPGIKAVTDLF